jgi:hypothetical protein
MQIRMFANPEQYIGAVKNSLQRLAAHPHPTFKLSFAADEVQIQSAHEVYDLRADEIAKGKDLTSARLTGVRYLVGDSAQPQIAAEVPALKSRAVPQTANLNFGKFVQATASGLKDLESRGGRGKYVLRLLRFSALGLMALWLVEEHGKENIIYPLDPAPPPLDARRLYSESDFLAAILPMAQRRAEQHEIGKVP